MFRAHLSDQRFSLPWAAKLHTDEMSNYNFSKSMNTDNRGVAKATEKLVHNIDSSLDCALCSAVYFSTWMKGPLHCDRV